MKGVFVTILMVAMLISSAAVVIAENETDIVLTTTTANVFYAWEDTSLSNTTNETVVNNTLTVDVSVPEAIAIAVGVVDGNVLSTELNFSQRYNRSTYIVRVERLDNGDTLVAEIDAMSGELLTNYNEIDFSEREGVEELNQVLVLEDGVTPVGRSIVEPPETKPKTFWQKIVHWFKNPFG